MERVLQAAHDPEEGHEGHTEVVDLGVRPWIAGTTASAVQMTIGGVTSDPGLPDPGVPEPERKRER